MNATVARRWSNEFPKRSNSLPRGMDQVFEHLFGNGCENSDVCRAPASLWETDGHWCVEVDLPGVMLENVDIILEKKVLRLVAERQGPNENGNYHHQERFFGRIERLIMLPETVDSESIEAELKDGVLRITLAKKPELQPKKIQIKGG